MQRSRTQVLFSYLPDSVFFHESGLVVRSHSIHGRELITDVNKSALLDAIDEQLRRWPVERRAGIPLPSRTNPTEFQIIAPEVVRWEIWPLVFECSRSQCGRTRLFWKVADVSAKPRCRHCGGRLRQLRYYSAHVCGATRRMYVPKCQNNAHRYDHVYFDDTGSFRTSVFRCRACAGGVIRRTLQQPCGCKEFPGKDGRSMMRAYSVRDTRTHNPHYVSLINLRSSAFDELQRHPKRGQIALASYFGVFESVSQAIEEADRGADRDRMSSSDWAKLEEQMRVSGLFDEAAIEEVRRVRGPVETGGEMLRSLEPTVTEMASATRFLERAVLFDRDEVQRITLDKARRMAHERQQPAATEAIQKAQLRSQELGLADISVTWNFPIAMAAFGYTRGVSRPGEGIVRGFARSREYQAKTPLFGVATQTEAVLIVLSASRVIDWLHGDQLVRTNSVDERSAREEILRLFARREVDPEPADRITTLLHSMSHALLRTLDDGQIGFAAPSLAEWIVPETLTFALYANNLKSFTLGALWTLLNNRVLQWLNNTCEAISRCENDPLCHQRHPQACERCLYLSFGCPRFNEDLDRSVLRSFWHNA